MSMKDIFPDMSGQDWKNEPPAVLTVTKKMIPPIRRRIAKIRQLLQEFNTVNVYAVDAEIFLKEEIQFWTDAINAKKFCKSVCLPDAYEHYTQLLKLIRRMKRIKYIDYDFYNKKTEASFKVDVIAEDGLLWVKLVYFATNEYADLIRGISRDADKIILEAAENLLYAADHNLVMSIRPTILFYFPIRTENEIIYQLKEMGIMTACGDDPRGLEEIINDFPSMTLLNLDTSTLVTLVSNLCHGGCKYKYNSSEINCQALSERCHPVKRTLEEKFENKRLICCRSAWLGLIDLLESDGGSRENERSLELLKHIELYQDVEMPLKLQKLNFKSIENSRTLKVVAFSFHMKAITITANKKFVRLCKELGITFPVYVHSQRNLTGKLEQRKPYGKMENHSNKNTANELQPSLGVAFQDTNSLKEAEVMDVASNDFCTELMYQRNSD